MSFRTLFALWISVIVRLPPLNVTAGVVSARHQQGLHDDLRVDNANFVLTSREMPQKARQQAPQQLPAGTSAR
jgi:hypothetical protein